MKVSRSFSLSGTDALHLDKDQSHGLELITADQLLVQAALVRGIQCLMLSSGCARSFSQKQQPSKAHGLFSKSSRNHHQVFV